MGRLVNAHARTEVASLEQAVHGAVDARTRQRGRACAMRVHAGCAGPAELRRTVRHRRMDARLDRRPEAFRAGPNHFDAA
jgi:hypothetical protein